MRLSLPFWTPGRFGELDGTSKGSGEACSTYEKYNIEYVLGEFARGASVLLQSMGGVGSTYKKYNVELIVEGSGHEATKCEFCLPVLLKSM